jgi:hypothetical protein
VFGNRRCVGAMIVRHGNDGRLRITNIEFVVLGAPNLQENAFCWSNHVLEWKEPIGASETASMSSRGIEASWSILSHIASKIA